jgi:hypothetical protein
MSNAQNEVYVDEYALRVDLFHPQRHSSDWALTIWRGKDVEHMDSFPDEKTARAWLRRAGYPYNKKQVPVKL